MANEVLETISAWDTRTHLEVRVEDVLKLQSGEPPYLYPRPQLRVNAYF